MTRDSLRATLDNLQVDPESAKDRPYLEAMLRRLGYTEKEIRAELGPVAEADTAPRSATPSVAPVDREYRLVVPARESAFVLDQGVRNDSPLDEGLQFEEVAEAGADEVEFEEVPEQGDDLEFEEVPAQDEVEFQEVPDVEALTPESTEAGLDELPLDTFGAADTRATPQTRVRVKRVRAKSRAEAEAKVASADRRVIKAVPVDIVERWGGQDEANQRKGGA